MGFEPVHEFFVELSTAFLIGLALLCEDDIVVLVRPQRETKAGFVFAEARGNETMRYADVF